MGKDKKHKTKAKQLLFQPSVSNENNTVVIDENKPATAEQIIEYLMLMDNVNALLKTVKYNALPQFVITAFLQLLIVEFDPHWNRAHQEVKDQYTIFQYWNYVCLAAFVMAGALSYASNHLQKSEQKELKFLPYFLKDTTQNVEQLYCEGIDDKKIIEKIKKEKSRSSIFIALIYISNAARVIHWVNESLNLSAGLLLLRDPNASFTLFDLLEEVLPVSVLYEFLSFFYYRTLGKNQHDKFLQQVKDWSHCDLWKESGPSKADSYFFDLSLTDSSKEMEINLQNLQLSVPVKIFFRELAITFLRMGLPVVFFNNERLVLHNWQGQNLRGEQSNLQYFNESLIAWHEIYSKKEKKLNQLNYISKQLKDLTSDHEPLSWQVCKYRTEKNLPAICFSADVSAMGPNKANLFFLEMQKIYGLEKVSMKDDCVVVEGVTICEQQINISVLKLLNNKNQNVSNFETDTSSGFYSTAAYRQKKTEQSEESNQNHKVPSEAERIAQKVKSIKKTLKSQYPNHVVVPLNSPRKDPGREFALVEEAIVKNALDTYSVSYEGFINSFKNISRVKSNNRGNGSSTTGLVGAVEPFRQFDGSWAVSSNKFKLSRNSRVFFKPIKSVVIDNERVDLIKASGFDPTYHRGRK